MREDWFTTDHKTDVLQSLRHTQRCKCAAAGRPEMWKWSIIALHNALQGALVCHLSGTQHLGALKADLGFLWLAYNQHDRDPNMRVPKTQLASIHVLFQRATTGRQTDRRGNTVEWVNDGGQVPIEASEKTRGAFRLLVALRNDFVHFSPKGWSIALSGLPEIVALIAEFIRRITEHGWAFRSMPQEECREMDRLLNELATSGGQAPS